MGEGSRDGEMGACAVISLTEHRDLTARATDELMLKYFFLEMEIPHVNSRPVLIVQHYTVKSNSEVSLSLV